MTKKRKNIDWMKKKKGIIPLHFAGNEAKYAINQNLKSYIVVFEKN